MSFMSLQLLERLQRHATDRPFAEAFRETQAQAGDQRNHQHAPPCRNLAYGELQRRVNRLADRLRRALPQGAVVLLCGPNVLEFPIAFLAVLAAGCAVFPLSPELAEPELLAAAEISGAAAIIGTDRALAILQNRLAALSLSCLDEESNLPIVHSPRCEFPVGLLLQSSGTTGRPKVVFRAGPRDAVARNVAVSVDFTPADHVLASAPLCHSYGVEQGLFAPLFAGSCVHLCRGFDWQVVHRELAASGISIFPGVPFMFEMFAGAAGSPERFPHLRTVYSAGAALPRAIFDAFHNRYGLTIGQIYGATEIGSVTYGNQIATNTNKGDDTNKGDANLFNPASVGWPMEGVQIRVLDRDAGLVNQPLAAGTEGQVAVSAPSMLSRYVGDPASPLIGGYFLTGDLGRLDAAGAITLTGRLKLLIDVGGQKVNPMEVEDVLLQHPAVGACVVVPIRVSQTLRRLKAVITPRRPGETLPAEELRQFVRSRLAAYKVPRVIETRAALPRSPTGKILRQQIDPMIDAHSEPRAESPVEPVA